jgi:putative transcriptional regulator
MAKKSNSKFVNGVLAGMTEIMESLDGKRKLTTRTVKITPPEKQLTPKEIMAMRKKLKMSQPVLANLLNVSTQAVRNWEQGVHKPSGATLRLLQIFQKRPEVMTDFVA